MRLLNVETRRLEEFHGHAIPPYAILSHTWGREEVTYQDLSKEDHKRKHGYKKLKAAAKRQLSYQSQLSEAINSMFRWYEASKVCLIYLEDVPAGLDPYALESAFRKSRWWTRGWTLQELLAPHHTIMFDCTWERIFTPEFDQGFFEKIALPVRSEEVVKHRQELSEDRIQTVIQQLRYGLITEITRIPGVVLSKDLPLPKVPAACKFSWASQRMTTRIEDKAYCLMGLLGVNMPLLYGEGEKAFVRLQEAVISSSDDISLLAWGYNLSWESVEELGYDKVLARSPAAFKGYPKSISQRAQRSLKTHSTVTGHGLHIELSLSHVCAKNGLWIGIIEELLDESRGHSEYTALVLRQKDGEDAHILERARGCPVLKISESCKRLGRGTVSKMVYLQDGGISSTPTPLAGAFRLPPLISSLRPFLRKRNKQRQYTTKLAIDIKSFRSVGYALSSQYPPIEHDIASLWPRDAQHLELSGGQTDESPFEYLICQGPGNELFYFILTNKEGHSVAVQVQIKYKPPYIHSYKVSLSHCGSERNATALEYACETGFGTCTAKQLSKQRRWSSYVNLWSPTATPIHVSAQPSQQNLSKKDVRYEECNLVWSGGWDEDDQHDTG